MCNCVLFLNYSFAYNIVKEHNARIFFPWKLNRIWFCGTSNVWLPCNIYSRYFMVPVHMHKRFFPLHWLVQTVIVPKTHTHPPIKKNAWIDRSRTGKVFLPANMKEILHGKSNNQNTLANVMIRLDTRGHHMENLTKGIRETNWIQDRLE